MSIGELVRWNLSPCDSEAFSAVGMIVEERYYPHEYRVLWTDGSVSMWCGADDLAPMQIEAGCGTT